MTKVGDIVTYNGETVKVVATPETLPSSDPKYYLIEGYSGGWYPSPGVQPRDGVTQGKKYFWVAANVLGTGVTTGGSSLTAADIKPGRYRVLSTKNVKDYEHNHHGKVVGEIVKITESNIRILERNGTFTIEDNRWGTNFVPSDFEWVGEPELLTQAPPQSKFGVGERVVYNGSEAVVVARADGGSMYTIQLFNGDGWLSTGKYWVVKEVDLKSAPVHTGNNVLLSDLVEKKSDKPVTNQSPDAYIQQPIIITKRKTKHSLTTV